jgi:hypothetical protein
MERKGKGICRLGLVPVRAGASDKAELVNQLLFGEHYTVSSQSEDSKWLYITIEFDKYTGWMDAKQHTEISDEYFDHLNSTEFKIATDITSTILYKKRLLQIVIGSVLPISSSELFEVSDKFAFNGASKNIGQKKGFEYLKQISKCFMNAPYLWGGKSPFGIDCSGLTQQLFKLCGYRLKRDASQQFLQGEQVQSLSDAKAGDLAFFRSESGSISHVGIVMEDSNILHASGYVRLDKFDEKGIYNMANSTYTHKLESLKRIMLA